MSCAMRRCRLRECMYYNKQGAQWKVRLSRGEVNPSFEKNNISRSLKYSLWQWSMRLRESKGKAG